MAKVYDNIRIYGDLDTAVYVGPKGSTLPTGLDTPDAALVEVGWLAEDGIGVDRNEEAQTHRALQGGTIVRRKKTSVEDTITFQCLEENAVVVGLHYAGQTPTVTEGVAKIEVKNQTASDDRAFVIDLVDGDYTKRFVIPSGSVSTGSLAHTNADMTVYEFTVTIQGDYDIYTNSPGIVGA